MHCVRKKRGAAKQGAATYMYTVGTGGCPYKFRIGDNTSYPAQASHTDRAELDASRHRIVRRQADPPPQILADRNAQSTRLV